MNLAEVNAAFREIGKAKAEWAKSITAFNADVEVLMRRLLVEAAANRMAFENIVATTGMSSKRVRVLMKTANLDPRKTPTFLAKQASRILQRNAEILKIDPSQMDLMSPLAYLPAGKELENAVQEEVDSVSQDARAGIINDFVQRASVACGRLTGRGLEDIIDLAKSEFGVTDDMIYGEGSK